jgi:hypothetical protein
MSLSSLALAWLMQQDEARAVPPKPEMEPRTFDLLPKPPHFEPRATAMISLFMGGGPSHLDMLDPKPMLDRYDGKIFPGDDVKFDNAGGASMSVMASPFKFAKQGQSGIEISELVPHLAEIVDDITLIRSMHLGGIRNHVAGMRALNTGRGDGASRPALGSWLTYGLGSESQNLPAFVAMQVGNYPPGSPYWSSGFLPSIYQGTMVREREPRILNLEPPPHLKGAPQRGQLALLETLNREQLEQHPGEDDLEARIASYELAARMQTAGKEVLDFSRETEATLKLYGIDDPATRKYGEACLIARRLVERGVRFVQLWYYAWDMHENIFGVLPGRCQATDKPVAGLVKDLKQRGLLDTTLVHWGGEMGRLPVVQNRGADRKPGRDHNTDGFSTWLAGGGVKRGFVYGATDEFGHKAVENPVHHSDFHATLLRLFGLDAARLAIKRGPREQSLLDGQPGRVIHDIMA